MRAGVFVSDAERGKRKSATAEERCYPISDYLANSVAILAFTAARRFCIPFVFEDGINVPLL